MAPEDHVWFSAVEKTSSGAKHRHSLCIVFFSCFFLLSLYLVSTRLCLLPIEKIDIETLHLTQYLYLYEYSLWTDLAESLPLE